MSESLRHRQDCGGSSSLSDSLLRLLVLRSDCTGLPAFSDEHVSAVDACGLCGGTGEHCLDCAGEVNGGKALWTLGSVPLYIRLTNTYNRV